MKYIKQYQLFERSLEEAEEELREFQTEMNLGSNVKALMKSMEATKLNLQSIFKSLSGEEIIDDLIENEKFQKDLERKGLKTSELYDTTDNATFIKVPMKFYWVNTDDATDLDTPVYILFQFTKDNNELSKLYLFLIQGDVNKFYDELSTVKLIIKRKNSDDAWYYVTSNSGEDWVLKKGVETKTFKKVLDWNHIEKLNDHKELELKFI